MYIQGMDKNQPMLLPDSVQDYVSEDNPVRAIDAFVDGLDFEQLGFILKKSHTSGRRCFHPSSLLKIFLWGYLSRIRSSRRLEQACTNNLELLWLTGCLTPDHTTLSYFRKNNAKAIQKVFREFTFLCVNLGLYSKELVAIDGSFIKAVNSKAKSFTKSKLDKLIELTDENLTLYLKQLESNDQRDESIHSNNGSVKEKIEALKKKKEKFKGLLKECENSDTGQVSLTDKDSRQLRKRNQHVVGYNLQIAVDPAHHLLAVCEVVQSPRDTDQLAPIAKQAKLGMGMKLEDELTVLADKGYGFGSQFQMCKEQNVRPLVPVQKQASASQVYAIGKFNYQANLDVYICPSGVELKRKKDVVQNGTLFKSYWNAKGCRGCQLKQYCTKAAYRKLKVNEHLDVMSEVAKDLADNYEVYQARKSLAEHPFGTLKSWNGREDLLCKGLLMAKMETSLSGWAYNFKRVIAVLGTSGLVKALQG